MMRAGEDLSSEPIMELTPGTRCIVKARGVPGRRLRVQQVETGQEGWISCVGKSGKILVQHMPALYGGTAEVQAPTENIEAAAAQVTPLEGNSAHRQTNALVELTGGSGATSSQARPQLVPSEGGVVPGNGAQVRLFAVLVAAALWHTVMAQDDGDDPSPEQILERLDIDKDGLLSEKEILGGIGAHFRPMIDEYWSKADTNQDGKLDVAELDKLLEYFQRHGDEV